MVDVEAVPFDDWVGRRSEEGKTKKETRASRDAKDEDAPFSSPDADDVVRVRDDIKHILADKFASPNLDENIFITRLRSFRVKLSLDDKRKVSFATEFFEADESGVAAILDPMIELNTSAVTRAELIDAVDLVLDAVRSLYEDTPGAR